MWRGCLGVLGIDCVLTTQDRDRVVIVLKYALDRNETRNIRSRALGTSRRAPAVAITSGR